MTAKLAEFLKERKIDQRRLLVASAQAERLTLADRKIKLAKRQKRANPEAAIEAVGKPRTGRPLSQRLLGEVLSGKKVPAPAKQRVLRAVNRILTQRKEDAIELRALF